MNDQAGARDQVRDEPPPSPSSAIAGRLSVASGGAPWEEREAFLLLANVRDSVIVTDLEGIVTYWNEGATRLFGWEASEMVGRSYAGRFPEPARTWVARNLQALAEGVEWSGEWEDYCKDGRRVWTDARVRRITDEIGRPVGILRIAHDISDRKRAEEALARREQLARTVIEAAGAVPYTRNYVTGRFDYVGPGIQALLGHAPEDFTVELWESLIQEVVLAGSGDGVSPAEANRLTREQEAPFWRADIRVRTASGEERWLFNAVARVLDDRGKTVASCGLLQDITERKRAVEALERSQEWFQAVFRASRDGIVVEADERIAYANEAAARLHGHDDPSGMIGQPPSAFQMPEDSGRMREYGRRRLRGEAAPSVYPFRGRRKDGTAIDLEASVSTCRIGSQEYIITVIHDLAERRELEEQLRQAQKMEAIGRLAGGVAHDFNNLLTVINGYTDLLLDSSRMDEVSHRLIAEVKKAGERAALLTRQLLAFSRKQVLQPRILDLNAVVAEAGEMLRRLIGEDVELVTKLDPALGPVRADPGQVGQVLLNLAVNARDAMPHGGRLTLETRDVHLGEGGGSVPPEVRPGPYALLAVRDTGVGMDEKTQAHLFEPFFTTKEVGKGTGLGLATVYGIVKQSGGHIEVESAPGQGTVFRVYLPRTQEAARTRGPATLPVLGGRETILLAEDEDAVRSLARQVLEVNGYSVLEARQGDEALALGRQHPGPIHLLVTDVVMPGLSGRQLAEQLAALRTGLRVLYISGYPDEVLGQGAALAEGVAFLPKPFSTTALAAKVRETLDGRHSACSPA